MAKAMTQATKDRLKRVQAEKRKRDVSIQRMDAGKVACCLDLMAGDTTDCDWTPAAAIKFLRGALLLSQVVREDDHRLALGRIDVPVAPLDPAATRRSPDRSVQHWAVTLEKWTAWVRLIRWPDGYAEMMGRMLVTKPAVAKLFKGPRSGRVDVPVTLFRGADIGVLFALLWPPTLVPFGGPTKAGRHYLNVASGHPRPGMMWDATELVKYLRTYVVGVEP